MRIGRLAIECSVSVQTLRYYERVGILPKARRQPNGYREYGDDAPARLQLVKGAQEFGFSLDEVREIIGLLGAKRADCRPLREMLGKKVDEVAGHVARIEGMARALKKALARCEGAPGGKAKCPFWDDVEKLAPEGE